MHFDFFVNSMHVVCSSGAKCFLLKYVGLEKYDHHPRLVYLCFASEFFIKRHFFKESDLPILSTESGW